MASGSHQRPQPHSEGFSPQDQGKPLAQCNGSRPVGTKGGAYMVLDTIMHHFSSEIQWRWFQNSIIPFQVQSSNPSPTFKEDSSSSVLHAMVVTRRPGKDSNSLAFQVLVFHLRTIQEGYFKMAIEKQDSFKETRIPCTIQ
ncbi:hypothetical protein O181_008948 [Austropuccinia psidii MF-1]|uniref:Uncharacterized protein n=1 Tax=Austropuccinia psidii MF-1 TaxID=1389203 RepID=A0A9Q3BQ49_9BASI|nr:hypothetical protein [Austropuccinia psidii MF-1]